MLHTRLIAVEMKVRKRTVGSGYSAGSVVSEGDLLVSGRIIG